MLIQGRLERAETNLIHLKMGQRGIDNKKSVSFIISPEISCKIVARTYDLGKLRMKKLLKKFREKI